MTGQHDLIPVTVSSAFAVGMVLALLGSIKLALAKRLVIDEARVGGLLSALFLAIIPLMLLSGLLIDYCGVQWVLIVGSLLTGLALSLLALSRTYAAALATVLLAGAGAACLSNSGSILMPYAFFPDNQSASQNFGNVFFGLGALATPALADLLLRRAGFRWTLGMLGLFCLVPALTASMAHFPPMAEGGGDLGSVLSDPILWLTALAFFLYVPLESVLSTWATTYLTDLGVTERRAAWCLSGFWLTFLAARLSASFLHLSAAQDPWVVLVLAVLAAVTLGNMAGAPGRGGATWGLLLVGAIFGPIFPTLVGILFAHFPAAQRGTAYGAMFALGATGSLLVPPIVGAYARRHSVQKALGITMVIALLLAAAILVLGLWLQMRR